MKSALSTDYLKILKQLNLNCKEDNQAYSIALHSIYERIKKFEIPVIDFIKIILLKNNELARIVIFKKAPNEPKAVQKIIFKLIIPYLKQLKDKKIEDLYQLAAAYEHIGEIDNEVTIANEILSRNPEDSMAYHRLGHIFSKSEKHALAIENMEKAANLDPKYFDCLGQVYGNAGDNDKAIEFAKKAIEYDSENAQAYDVLGHAFSKAEKHALAIENIEKAANLDPQYFACLGQVYSNAEDDDKAIEFAKKAIEYDPKNGKAYHVLGHAFSKAEKHALAIENMEKAANLDPKYFDCLGQVYDTAGHNDKAIEFAKKAIEYDPKNGKAYHILGHAFSNAEKQALAIENMEKAANLNPKYFVCLGQVYDTAGDNDKAIEFAKKAIEYDPKNAQAYYVLGHAFSKAEKHALAIENMEKAANLDPQYFASVGQIYADDLYEYPEAINYFNKYLEIYPQSDDNKANIVEALLGASRFDDVITISTEILDDPKENTRNLNVRFIVLCSKIFQGSEIDKKKLISDFLEYYEALPNDFENSWNYKGIIHMIENADLDRNDREPLISLIDLLEMKISIDDFKKNFLD